MINIYTDGACKGNPGPGGWGALIIDGDIENETLDYKLINDEKVINRLKNENTRINVINFKSL